MIIDTCPHCLGTKASPLSGEDCHVCRTVEICLTCSGKGVIGSSPDFEDCPDCENGKVPVVAGTVRVDGRHGKNAAHSIAAFGKLKELEDKINDVSNGVADALNKLNDIKEILDES